MPYADDIANVAKLLTACAAFATKPGLKTGTSIYDAVKRVLKRNPPGISAIADEMSALIEARIAKRSDLPNDATVLLEQMIAQTLPSAEDIVANSMNAEAIARHMQSQLTETEHLRRPMPQLFEDVVTTVFSRLLPAAAFAQDLTPAFMAQVLENTSMAAETTRDILETFHQRTEGELRQAANFFADAPPATASPYEVMRFLELRAETLSTLQSQFEALDRGMKALLELHLKTRVALQNLDIATAATALEDLQSEHLRQVVAAGESLGEIFIKKKNMAAAHWVMSASSDVYSGFNTDEVARVRIKTFAPQLMDGAQRISPEFAQYALQLVSDCLTDDLKNAAPVLWGNGQNVVLSACAIILKTIQGPHAEVFFKMGLDAFDAALPTRDIHTEPAAWAELHNNRSRLYQLYGEVTGDPAYFENARRDLEASLKVYTRGAFPSEHARSVVNLASLHLAEGHNRLSQGKDAIRSLKLSRQYYDDALQTYTFDADPEAHIRAQVDLGALNMMLGAGIAGAEGRRFLEDARRSIETTRTFFISEERFDKWLFGSIRLVAWHLELANHETTSRVDAIGALQDARALGLELGPVFAKYAAPDLEQELVVLGRSIEEGLAFLQAT